MPIQRQRKLLSVWWCNYHG